MKDDDEERFKELLPHEISNRPGVRSMRPHTLQVIEGDGRGLYKERINKS
jgi:hypothetical protein